MRERGRWVDVEAHCRGGEITVKKKMVKTFLRFETALVKRLKVEEEILKGSGKE